MSGPTKWVSSYSLYPTLHYPTPRSSPALQDPGIVAMTAMVPTTSTLQLSLTRPPPRPIRKSDQPPPGLRTLPVTQFQPAHTQGPPRALTQWLQQLPPFTLSLLPAQGILCCMLACFQCYNTSPGTVPHILYCLQCHSLFVRGRVASSTSRGNWGQDVVSFTGGADLFVALPPGDSQRGCPIALVQPTVVVPTRGLCYALTSTFQGRTHPVRTLTPRKEGASTSLLNAYDVMPNIHHPNFQEMWTAMTNFSAVDNSFTLPRFSRWLAGTVPEGEPRVTSGHSVPPLPYQRTAETSFCENWSAVVESGDAPDCGPP